MLHGERKARSIDGSITTKLSGTSNMSRRKKKVGAPQEPLSTIGLAEAQSNQVSVTLQNTVENAPSRGITTLGLVAPKWLKDGKKQVQTFLLEWKSYQRSVNIRIANDEPVCALRMVEAVQQELLETILAHELPRSPETITDEEFTVFLNNRIEDKTIRKYLTVKDLTPLKLNSSIDIIQGRVSKLYFDMRENLLRLDASHYITEPSKYSNKIMNEYLINAITGEAKKALLDETMSIRESSGGLNPDNLFAPMVRVLKAQEIYQTKQTSIVSKFGKHSTDAWERPWKRQKVQVSAAKVVEGSINPRLKTSTLEPTKPLQPSRFNLEKNGRCAKCNSELHKIKHCPDANPGEVEEFYELLKNRKKISIKRVNMLKVSSINAGANPYILQIKMNDCQVCARFDTGSDITVCSMETYNKIGKPTATSLKKMKILLADGVSSVQAHITFEANLKLPGKMEINTQVVALEHCAEELLLGVDFMTRAGINFNKCMLEQVEPEVQTVNAITINDKPAAFFEEQVQLPQISEFANVELSPDERLIWNKFILEELPEVVKRRQSKPIRRDMVQVQIEDSQHPVNLPTRKYTPSQEDYMDKWCKELLSLGFIEEAPESKWSSPVLVVCSQDGRMRLTTDLRDLNKKVQLIRYPLPNLDSLAARVKSSRYFFNIDAAKGYWQILLHPNSRDFFSFTTHRMKFRPLRLPQGYKNSVSIFQDTMNTILKELIPKGLEVQLDDILGFGVDFPTIFELLKDTLIALSEANVLINFKKSCLMSHSVIWCGRQVNQLGVTYNPRSIASFLAMDLPSTGEQLSKFIHGINFFRPVLPNFSRVSELIYLELNRLALLIGSRKNRKLASTKVIWTPQLRNCFKSILELIQTPLTLGFPSENDQVFVISNASDHGFAVIITSTPPGLKVPLMECSHTPVGMISGLFSEQQRHWGIIEREMYPLVLVTEKLRTILHRSKGFKFITDNLTLKSFLMGSTALEMRRPIGDKLMRWKLRLMPFNFTTEHIVGTSNLFTDMVSRLTGKVPDDMKITLQEEEDGFEKDLDPIVGMIHLLDSMADTDFELPSLASIKESCGIVMKVGGKIAIPNNNISLIHRILVAAHSLAHRSVKTTEDEIRKFFTWTYLHENVVKFVSSCLHCGVGDSSLIINRPLDHQMRSVVPFALIHLDFFQFEEKYVLVIKDDFTGTVGLFHRDKATPADAAACLSSWIACHGAPRTLLTDNGTHFKNQLLADMVKKYNFHHRFTLPEVHRSNGSIESINKQIMFLLRALRSELRLPVTRYAELLPMIQSIINSSPSSRLNNRSPFEIVNGTPPQTVLMSVLNKEKGEWIYLRDWDKRFQNLVLELWRSIDALHLEVDLARVRRDKYNSRKYGRQLNLTIGDFILFSRPTEKKSQFIWMGPYQVMAVVSNLVFKIRDILTHEEIIAHAARLKKLTSDVPYIDERVLEQAKFLKYEYKFTSITNVKKEQLQIKWSGPKYYEHTYEDAEDIFIHYPKQVLHFVQVHSSSAAVKNIANKLGIDV